MLDTLPEAFLMADISTCSPEWWDRLHGEELVQWEDGTSRRPLGQGSSKGEVPSLASDLWLKTMRENVRFLVRHIENSPYAERFIGYVVAFGHAGSWTHFGTHEGYFFDFNPQVRARFRTWLEQAYPSERALSEAWGRETNFHKALPPTPAEMIRPRDFAIPWRSDPASITPFSWPGSWRKELAIWLKP